MNFISNNIRVSGVFVKHAKGFTLLEVLVSIAIAMVFMVGIYAFAINLMDTQAIAKARSQAIVGARALDVMAERFQGALAGTTATDGKPCFLASTQKRAWDSREEVVDGKLNVGSFSIADDQHAQLHPKLKIYERPQGVNKPDLGDKKIDTNAAFSLAEVSFWHARNALGAFRTTYHVGEYDSRHNVLIQTLTDEVGNLVDESPMAFGVMSFDALFWDQDGDGTTTSLPVWHATWDSRTDRSMGSSEIKSTLPICVYLRLTLEADSRPLEDASDTDLAAIGAEAIQTSIYETMAGIVIP